MTGCRSIHMHTHTKFCFCNNFSVDGRPAQRDLLKNSVNYNPYCEIIEKMETPLKVSPLIKVSRYVMLGLGIMYGTTRQAMNQATMDAWRAKEEAERPAREAAMKAAKEKASREEMAYLAKQAGVPVGGSGGKDGGKGGESGGSGMPCGCDSF